MTTFELDDEMNLTETVSYPDYTDALALDLFRAMGTVEGRTAVEKGLGFHDGP